MAASIAPGCSARRISLAIRRVGTLCAEAAAGFEPLHGVSFDDSCTVVDEPILNGLTASDYLLFVAIGT